ncbi:alpha-L-arabinofuranosidase C-terminal domain-containing protein [Vibrio cortegadensis]|uniref:alpha-N-arabinofuranosidase n=1 Tax=Vibrio cortegadensis TaxID=1328770 RepID=UPI0021C41076|nr:alpha-L-arabinofuranosidase C-terminal domain-containing protein [Vibrio cortegadensis]MDN3697268.1 alpha-L-arabinofuranosidase C-terminal domain-containing protein [Vibrio cortegadensis]
MKKLVINEKKKISTISEDIYGHFAEHLGRCIYEGIFVGKDSNIPHVNGMRSDVVGALKELEIPVLRWPGGCFAEDYHWKSGVGPLETRKSVINSLWGGVLESNHFGTHEFFELCEQLECKNYINVNMGSGSVKEMQDWIEYMTASVDSELVLERKANGREEPWELDYIGVGNEMWGCGGMMNPEHYASEFRRYNNFARTYDWNAPFRRIASGPNRADYDWTDKVMKGLMTNHEGRDEMADFHEEMTQSNVTGLALHYYCFPTMERPRGDAREFSSDEWYKTLESAAHIEELIVKHTEIMRKHDPEGKVELIVDEWGAWYDADEGTNPFWLYQQNTMRCAQVAALSLNIFNKHSDSVGMANIAQTVNVLQAMILTEGDKMITTPTYHVFNMYKGHKNAKLVESHLEGVTEIGVEGGKVPELFESVSINRKGVVNMTLNNTSMADAQEIEIEFAELTPSKVKVQVLAGEYNAHNTFDAPENVVAVESTDYTITDKGIKLSIPACAIVAIEAK